MREHAIPQDITGYRFHIIGNMTLKQFAEIGAGCIIGFLFYTTNLPTVIKWPFIGLSIGLGALVAFVPVEERPLDHWLTTFIKVLYKPTKFFWRREPKIPDAFTYTPLDNVVNEQQETDFRPARKQRIKEYLRSVEPPKAIDQFDWSRLQQIDNIMATFDQTVVNNVDAQQGTQRPDLKVRMRSLAPNPDAVPTDVAEGDVQISWNEPNMNLNQAILDDTSQGDAYANMNRDQSVNNRGLQTNEVAQNLYIPEIENISLKPSQEVAAEAQAAIPEISLQQGVYLSEAAPAQPAATSDQDVTLNSALPFPTAPTEPNKVVGMCLTPNNEIIAGAIVEIQASDGQVARAVKTNTLGQFFVTTPLSNGAYVILVEKEGYTFSPLRLDLNGEVIPPIEIRSA